MARKVKPRLSRGLQDYLPQQMIARQRMVDTIRGVFEGYGFSPLSTPAIEYLDVLRGSAGEEATGSIFTVHNPEQEDLGLRFDLTVPLARVVAQYRDLPRPFRRYQVASVWRADKPGAGRFREFTQFDIDSVGTKSELADTEIIAAICDTLAALQVGGYRVRYSSRGILNVLLAFADLPESAGADVFRVLDKLGKVGLEKVKRELTTGYKDESGDTIRGLGLEDGQVAKIEAFLGITGETRAEVLAALANLFAGTPGAEESLAQVTRISDHLQALGYGDDRVKVDPSIARGLAYYTGPVFEADLEDAPQFGSVFSGGRYDGLVSRFSGEQVPATGASVGVDRLLAALDHLGQVRERKTTTQVLVCNMDADLESEVVALTWELRRAGIAAELFLGGSRSPGKQLKYADRCGIPLALFYGSQEQEHGVVQIKDLDAGRRQAEKVETREEWIEARPGQREVPLGELVATLRELLGQIEGE